MFFMALRPPEITPTVGFRFLPGFSWSSRRFKLLRPSIALTAILSDLFVTEDLVEKF